MFLTTVCTTRRVFHYFILHRKGSYSLVTYIWLFSTLILHFKTKCSLTDTAQHLNVHLVDNVIIIAVQVSLIGLHSQAQAQFQEYPDSEDDAAVVITIPRMPKPEKLDIRSCLQFLLELFEQWMSPYVQPRTPLMLLSEATKAVSQLEIAIELVLCEMSMEWY